MAQPAAGALYDRGSWSWRLNSKWFVLLGGARAAIMQTADPSVAAGVAQFSSYRTDPLGRLERTLDAVTTIGFGSPGRRAEVLADLRRIHSAVRGRTGTGAPYSALDPGLMFWVLATLVDTVLVVEQRYVGRLRGHDRCRYYDESKVVAEAFGIPDRFVPEDLAAFRTYVAQRVATIRPDAASAEITRSLLRPGLAWVPNAAFVPLDWITLELLPTTLRRGLGLADLTPAQLRVVRGAQAMSRVTLPRLPDALATSPFTARTLRRAA